MKRRKVNTDALPDAGRQGDDPIASIPWDRLSDGVPKVPTWAAMLHQAAISTKDLLDRDIPEPERILSWWRAGDLGYIYGNRGSGKTFWAVHLMLQVASGLPVGPWKGPAEPVRVLYVDGEMPAYEQCRRIRSMLGGGAPPEHLLWCQHELLFEQFGVSLDLARAESRQAILRACLELGAKVVVLDNQSCLATVSERDGDAWASYMLHWHLTMRRHGISVVWLAHAGRNGMMRGHSRREDPAAWIIEVESMSSETEKGRTPMTTEFAKFRYRERELLLRWDFVDREDGGIDVRWRLDDEVAYLLCLVGQGLQTNAEIAAKSGWSPAKVSRIATAAQTNGQIVIKGRK